MPKSKEESEEDAKLGALMQECNNANAAGDVKRAEALSLEIMAAIMARADDEPSPWLALVTQAAAHEDRHEWQDAERCYRDALAVAIDEGGSVAFKAHSDLADFLSLMERKDEALVEARLSEHAARKSMKIVCRMGLQTLASYERDSGNWKRARELIEVVLTMEDLQQDRMEHAGVLVSRARCHVHDGDIAAAQADLDTSWQILKPYQARTIMAGHHSSLASWWRANADLQAQLGNTAEECKAASQGVEQRRIVADARQLKRSIRLSGLISSLRRYAKALAGAGPSAESEAVEQELSDLLVMLYGPSKAPPNTASSQSGGD